VAALGKRGDRIRALAEIVTHPDPSQLWFQLAEIAGDRTYLRHGVRVQQGDVVLDVGANVGVAAAFFASQCGARVVHCFEPVPPVCGVLRENVRRLPACVVHEFGLSATNRDAELTYYPGSAAMSGEHADPERDRHAVLTVLMNLGFSAIEAEQRVAGRWDTATVRCEMRTLSSFLNEEALDHVDLLKIDVERAELDVLRGVDDPDWPKIRQVVMEVHDEDGRLDEITRMLASHGFKVAVDQDSAMRGTDVHMLYATRP
jgi:31-O-methyltransferase